MQKERALAVVRAYLEAGRRRGEAIVAEGKATQAQLETRLGEYRQCIAYLEGITDPHWWREADSWAGVMPTLAQSALRGPGGRHPR